MREEIHNVVAGSTRHTPARIRLDWRHIMDSLTPHDYFQQAFSFDEPDSSQPQRTCAGPCGRVLPATVEFFYRDKYSKDGMDTRCKDCDWAKRNKTGRLRRKQLNVEVPPGQKLCTPCEQLLPATSEFFYRDRSKNDGLMSTCKKCSHHRKGEGIYRASLDIPEGMKRCAGRCKQLKPANPEFFQRANLRKDGLYPYCKVCSAEKRNTPEARAAKLSYNRAYYNDQENHDKILTQRRDNYHNDPEIRQLAIDRNKRPEVKEYQRAYLKEYNSSPDAPARKKLYGSTRRTRKKSVSGKHTAQQITALLKRQKHKCYYCAIKFEKHEGKYVYQVEHTFPLSRVSGTDIPANDISYLVLACPSCNKKKRAKFPWEFPEGGRLF